MGVLILIAILVVALMILLSRSMRARGKARVEETEQAARDAVVRSLEDHRRMRDKDVS